MSRILKATGVVAISTLASRLLGFARDVLMANFFGAHSAADIFYIAFMIPNLFRRFVAEGAFTVSFVPVYAEYSVRRGEREALQLAQKMLTLQSLAVLVLVAMVMTLAPGIWDLFFHRAEGRELGILLTRIMFPYLFFVAFLAFAMGVLNTRGRFFAPAFSPVLLNAGIITGVVALRHCFTEPIVGVAAGVIVGGILQSVLQLPGLARTGFRFAWSLDINHPGVRRILALMVPTLFGTAVYLVNQFVSNALAYLLPPGSVTYIYYTNRLTELVMGLFVVSLASVILPEMSRISAERDIARLGELYTRAASGVLFLAIPAGAALMVIGYPLMSVFFVRGAFTLHDARLAALSLFYASAGMAFVAMLRITTPAFYALKDTRTPALAAGVSLFVNAALGWYLMHTTLGHAGLMLANSVSSLAQAVILVAAIRRRLGAAVLGGLAARAIRITAAAAAMALAVYLAAECVDWVAWSFLVRVAALGGVIAAGMFIYAAAAWMLRVEEMHYLATWVLNRLSRLAGRS